MFATVSSGARSTVDEAEVRKFGEMADRWWHEEKGPFAGLHQMNAVRVPFIRHAVLDDFPAQTTLDASLRSPPQHLHRTALAGKRILDIGCGGGILAEALARSGGQVTGIDASRENIEAAKIHAARDSSIASRLSYACITAEELAAQGELFDAVVASEVIEHVADVDTFVGACKAMVKPGGRLVITTINRTPKSFALAIVGAEYIARIVPAGTHDWGKFLKPEEISRLLECGGEGGTMRVAERIGFRYNPLTGAWSTAPRDLDVNYGIIAVKETM